MLNSLIKDVTESYETYEPTRAGRAISEFVTENLSNWYVRLSRKRFWGGEYDTDKISAYQTLYTCLETVAKLAAPIAPFYMDQLYCDLNRVSGRESDTSVHLTLFPKYNENAINKELEERMDIAQKVSSMILGLRRREKLKVRQPLAKIIVPVLSENFRKQFEAVESIILAEVNVKKVEYLTDSEGIIKKKIKANFKTLGPKYGKLMKAVSVLIGNMSQPEIAAFERAGTFDAMIEGEQVTLALEDVVQQIVVLGREGDAGDRVGRDVPKYRLQRLAAPRRLIEAKPYVGTEDTKRAAHLHHELSKRDYGALARV